MELSIFVKELESALQKRGISEEIAHKHVSNIRRTFTSEDLSEINAIKTADEIGDLADSIAVILKKRSQSDSVQEKPASPKVSPKPKSPHIPKPAPLPAEVKQSFREPENDDFDMNDDYFTHSNESSQKGITTFWVGLILTLPITLALLALVFGGFAGLFVGLVGAIVLGILLLIALVAAGSVASLVGIIFGVTQLFSFVPAAIYEIGIGIIIAGIVVFVSVLLYNLVIRVIPWLIKKVAQLLVYVCGKLKMLFYYVRRECYKL